MTSVSIRSATPRVGCRSGFWISRSWARATGDVAGHTAALNNGRWRMDLGVIFFAPPRMSAQIGRSIEELGFSTLLYPDSQNLAPDVWSQLNLAAHATSKIRIGTGVTNTVTRDPAVTACAALTLQVESQ